MSCGHHGGRFAVGAGRTIATRRRRDVCVGQWIGLQLQGIPQVIQAETVAELSVEQSLHVAARRKAAHLTIGTRAPRNLQPDL